MAEAQEIDKLKATQELTQERLRDLNTLEIQIKTNLDDTLDKINAQIGGQLESRGEGYHITIIGPTERKILESLTNQQLDELKRISSDIEHGMGIEVTGIGFIDGSQRTDMREVDKVKKTCFLTFNIPALQEFRASIGLPHKDFHVTLGFENGDIHMHTEGINEKGKAKLAPIEKRPNQEFTPIANDLPILEFSGLDGQLKQKKET